MGSTKRGLTMVVVAVAALIAIGAWWGSTGPGGGANGAAAATGGDPECTTVRHSLAALRTAAAAAGAGDVVCLADGTYGDLVLDGGGSAPAPLTVRAEHPGRAILAAADLGRSKLTLARFAIADGVTVEPGTAGVTVAHNRVSGGYLGVDAGPTTTTTVNDVAIVGNKFVGPFGEDAIRLNRYHDANGDGVGALVASNEFTNVRENGNHSDCLQTVWVGDHLVFRGNYLHDNRCQGFFVKDQRRPVKRILVEDNLIVRNEAPCAAGAEGCGAPSDLQIFGPHSGLTMRRNTIWGNGAIAAFQESDGTRARIERNVVYKFWTSADLSAARFRDNTRCQRQSSGGGSWPARVVGEVVSCSPRFRAPRLDDYRVGGGRGVTWAPGERHFGP
ncbi:MAG TPA: right-handed parallel beta-helix repeat-containing protein [Solirubrobacterales bacterium]|nr:right-handed parallel beta-helix repeat-containing protein [Solirubrobacterales bacterium]